MHPRPNAPDLPPLIYRMVWPHFIAYRAPHLQDGPGMVPLTLYSASSFAWVSYVCLTTHLLAQPITSVRPKLPGRSPSGPSPTAWHTTRLQSPLEATHAMAAKAE